MTYLGASLFAIMTSLQPEAPWLESYQETAYAIADACDERPIFGSPERCASILVALAYHESRFDTQAEGDGGRSFGAFQISRHWLKPGQDIETQARKAIDLIVESQRVCRRHPLEEKLGWYASGGATCGRPKSSRIRMHLAKQIFNRLP